MGHIGFTTNLKKNLKLIKTNYEAKKLLLEAKQIEIEALFYRFFRVCSS